LIDRERKEMREPPVDGTPEEKRRERST